MATLMAIIEAWLQTDSTEKWTLEKWAVSPYEHPSSSSIGCLFHSSGFIRIDIYHEYILYHNWNIKLQASDPKFFAKLLSMMKFFTTHIERKNIAYKEFMSTEEQKILEILEVLGTHHDQITSDNRKVVVNKLQIVDGD